MPPSVKSIGIGRKDGPAFDRPMPIDFVDGCALMVKRAVFEQVGGYDDEYKNYMEDFDFAYRVRAAGFKIGYVPTARLYHKIAVTQKEDPKRLWFIGRNTVLFYRKYHRFPAWQLWCYIVWMSIRETAKGKARDIPGYWRGFMDGFKLLKQKQRNSSDEGLSQ